MPGHHAGLRAPILPWLQPGPHPFVAEQVKSLTLLDLIDAAADILGARAKDGFEKGIAWLNKVRHIRHTRRIQEVNPECDVGNFLNPQHWAQAKAEEAS